MYQGIFPTIAGALFNEKRLNIIANNLANVNTAGFKQQRAIFYVPENFISNEVRPPSPKLEPLSSSGNPFYYVEVTNDLSSGKFHKTGNPLDMALGKSGFFEIATPQGPRYTRNGNFTLSEKGRLITQDGFSVQGEAGEIVCKGTNISVSSGGAVTVDGRLEGTLKIVDFPDYDQIRRLENGLYAPIGSDVKKEKGRQVEVMQGFIESSNVNTVREMTKMIEVMRSYEAYQKIFKLYDDINAKAVNEVGRIT